MCEQTTKNNLSENQNNKSLPTTIKRQPTKTKQNWQVKKQNHHEIQPPNRKTPWSRNPQSLHEALSLPPWALRRPSKKPGEGWLIMLEGEKNNNLKEPTTRASRRRSKASRWRNIEHTRSTNNNLPKPKTVDLNQLRKEKKDARGRTGTPVKQRKEISSPHRQRKTTSWKEQIWIWERNWKKGMEVSLFRENSDS